MHKEKQKKIIYYKDELNDDFAGTKINAKKVDSSFKFVHKNIIWRFFSWLIYYGIAVPFLGFYCRVIKKIKIVNKKALKKIRKSNFYFYGNHTGAVDAFIPSLISLPQRTKIVISSDGVSIKGLKNIVQMVGGLPVPDGLSGMSQFVKAMQFYNDHKYNIAIYPEAHIWPYYTKIRPFKDASFGYPIMHNKPIVAFCTTYQKPTGLFKKHKKANTTVYVSDPIYPDLTKPKKEAQKELRDKVYNFMVETAEKYSNFEAITYLPYTKSPDYIAEQINKQNKN